MADHIPPPPEDWEDIPLGAGQEPTVRKFQVSDRPGWPDRPVRKHPDANRLIVVIKPPERPY